MNFVKEHKILSSIIVVAIIILASFYYIWFKKNQEKKLVYNEIKNLNKDRKNMILFKYKLNDNNITISNNNLFLIKNFYKENLFLFNKFSEISFPQKMKKRSRPVSVHLDLISWVKKNIIDLNKHNIKVNDLLSFSKYAKSDSPLPLVDSINLIYKHIFIVNFLIDLFKESGVEKIINLERPNGLIFSQQKYWSWSRYKLKVSGQISALKKIINEISNNNKLFMIIKSQNLSSKIDILSKKEQVTVNNEKIKIDELISPFLVNSFVLTLVFDVYQIGESK